MLFFSLIMSKSVYLLGFFFQAFQKETKRETKQLDKLRHFKNRIKTKKRLNA